jgi:hypothetical protein
MASGKALTWEFPTWPYTAIAKQVGVTSVLEEQSISSTMKNW